MVRFVLFGSILVLANLAWAGTVRPPPKGRHGEATLFTTLQANPDFFDQGDDPSVKAFDIFVKHLSGQGWFSQNIDPKDIWYDGTTWELGLGYDFHPEIAYFRALEWQSSSIVFGILEGIEASREWDANKLLRLKNSLKRHFNNLMQTTRHAYECGRRLSVPASEQSGPTLN